MLSTAVIGGKKIHWLNIIDKYSREYLGGISRYSWRNADIIEILSKIMILRGTPEYLCSDNGCCESCNSRMRDAFLDGALFSSCYVTEVLTKRWLKYYNEIRFHSGRGETLSAPQSQTLEM